MADELLQIEDPSMDYENLHQDDTLSEDRSTIKKVTKNPIKYLKLVKQQGGPLSFEMTESTAKTTASEFMNKIAKSNKFTFNQQIDLSATFGGVEASSSTSFGFESATDRESTSSKKLEEKISKAMTLKYSIPAGQYYLILAEVAVYVFNQKGERKYVQKPTGKVLRGIKTFKYLENYLKDKSFEYVYYEDQHLTTYSVEEMVAALPKEEVKKAVEATLPQEGKFYTLTSAFLKNIGLQQWYGKPWWWYVGCIPEDKWDDNFKSKPYVKQWKFIPVEHSPDLFYIVNRQFNTALYAYEQAWGSWPRPDYGKQEAYQWVVKFHQDRKGSITIQNKDTKQYMYAWAQEIISTPKDPELEHYNCGPKGVFDAVRSVSRKWGKFCLVDRADIFSSSFSVADRFFRVYREREFAKEVMKFRNGSPTCSSSKNPNMFKKMKYFMEATKEDMDEDAKLWKLEEV